MATTLYVMLEQIVGKGHRWDKGSIGGAGLPYSTRITISVTTFHLQEWKSKKETGNTTDWLGKGEENL